MRKYTALLLLAFLMISLMAGCDGKSGTDDTNEKNTTTANLTDDKNKENTDTDNTSEQDGTSTNEDMIKMEIKSPSEFSQTGQPEEGETIAIIKVKDMGEIRMKFFYEDSPLAVENFVTLAANGYYDGVAFHRVIENFMIQGGDPTGTGEGGESMWGEYFKNEYSERLAHINGSVAMARTDALDTNGSQFFINNNEGVTWTDAYLSAYNVPEQWWDNYMYNGGNPHLQDLYTVFGQVYSGMDVVDAISAVSVTTDNEEYRPVTDVVIESIEITTYTANEPTEVATETEAITDTTTEAIDE